MFWGKSIIYVSLTHVYYNQVGVVMRLSTSCTLIMNILEFSADILYILVAIRYCIPTILFIHIISWVV